jgi:hypothetical protein
MQRSNVVIITVQKNTTLKLKDITTLQVRNLGKVTVFVNGLQFDGVPEGASVGTPLNLFKPIIYPDGTASDIDIDIKFDWDYFYNRSFDLQDSNYQGTENSIKNDQKIEIVYKKLKKCSS